MSEEKSFSDIPDIPGEIFKDVTFEKDANKLIGLFSPGFSQTGKKIVKWISYDPERKYVPGKIFRCFFPELFNFLFLFRTYVFLGICQ